LDLFIALIGLVASAFGAVLLITGGRPAEDADPALQRRARWRSRQGMGLLGLGIVLLFVGGVWLPYRSHLSGIGTTGVLLLIVLQVLALMLNAIGIVLLLLNRVAFGSPDVPDDVWLAHARRYTRIGAAVLVVGLLAQLGAVAIFAV
jgi:hypothetical protein